MGEAEYDVSGPSATIDDIAEMLADEIKQFTVFTDHENPSVLEANTDANGTLNVTLSNGQGFRISVEEDNLERTGT